MKHWIFVFEGEDRKALAGGLFQAFSSFFKLMIFCGAKRKKPALKKAGL
ncbi:hypothetical protein [Deinococcus roseus]|nr:hypothetical protein [Deinococcus roseus]